MKRGPEPLAKVNRTQTSRYSAANAANATPIFAVWRPRPSITPSPAMIAGAPMVSNNFGSGLSDGAIAPSAITPTTKAADAATAGRTPESRMEVSLTGSGYVPGTYLRP